MDYLNEYLQRPEVAQVITRCRESRAVQGVIAELDETWLRAWRLGESYNPSNPPAGYEMARDHESYFRDEFGLEFARPRHAGTYQPIGPIGAADLKWEPKWWPRGRRLGPWNADGPVRLRICTYPRSGHESNQSLPELGDTRVNFVFESRPIPRLAAAANVRLNPLVGGGSIGTGPHDFGTLGGLLQDGSGRHYGVTCAHIASGAAVVHHPSQHDSGLPYRIGQVVHFQLPKLYPPGLPLTPASQAAHSNEVDAALVQIDPPVATQLDVDALGPIAGLFPAGQIQQWQAATFAGRTSGLRTVEFRGRFVYYNVPDLTGTHTICFNNLYEIQWAPNSGHGGQPPIQGGDSGAWLCIGGPNGYEWAAMVVAWDPMLGFAISASALQTWWQSLGLNLKPM